VKTPVQLYQFAKVSLALPSLAVFLPLPLTTPQSFRQHPTTQGFMIYGNPVFFPQVLSCQRRPESLLFRTRILLPDQTQYPAPKFRGFASIGNSTQIAMLQAFATLLLIAPPQEFDLAVTQPQHGCGIDQLQFLFGDSSHHFHSLQLTGAHCRPLQQNLPWLEVSV
jgi:hypothetical protein